MRVISMEPIGKNFEQSGVGSIRLMFPDPAHQDILTGLGCYTFASFVSEQEQQIKKNAMEAFRKWDARP